MLTACILVVVESFAPTAAYPAAEDQLTIPFATEAECLGAAVEAVLDGHEITGWCIPATKGSNQ